MNNSKIRYEEEREKHNLYINTFFPYKDLSKYYPYEDDNKIKEIGLDYDKKELKKYLENLLKKIKKDKKKEKITTDEYICMIYWSDAKVLTKYYNIPYEDRILIRNNYKPFKKYFNKNKERIELIKKDFNYSNTDLQELYEKKGFRFYDIKDFNPFDFNPLDYGNRDYKI